MITVAAFVLLAVAIAAAIMRWQSDAGVVVQLDWTVQDSCPDALLIGAAGSGQRDDILGVGPQVESAVSAFSTHLMEQSPVSINVGFTALDYSAPGIIEGTLQGLRGNGMFESIAEGRTTLIDLIGDTTERCEGTAIYVIGFSQGASVVHTAIVEMPVEYQSSIAGAVVLADPFRDADDPNVAHFASEPDPTASGTPTPHIRDGSLTGLAVPDWAAGSFYSACALRDTVCNFALRDLLVTEAVHTEETYNGLGPQMGRLLADDLIRRGTAADA